VRLVYCLALAFLMAISLATRSSKADSESSEQLLQDGVALRRAGKDAEALELFRRARQASPSPRALAQVALAEQALARWAEAEQHLDLVLQTDDPWVIERRSLLLEALKEVRSRLGTLEVSVNRAGAEVWLDGNPVGTMPIGPLRLATGKHEVEVRASGFEPATQTVQIRSGNTTTANFSLHALRERTAVTARMASPRVVPRESRVARQEASSWRRTAGWIGIGVAGALLAGAITAHSIREREMAAYNDDSRCLRGTQSRNERCGDRLQASETAQTVAVLGYAATGVTLGASVFLLMAESPAQTGQKVFPVQRGYSGAQLGWAGTF
jgi:tetratricopeptide (TPR) repeat protein